MGEVTKRQSLGPSWRLACSMEATTMAGLEPARPAELVLQEKVARCTRVHECIDPCRGRCTHRGRCEGVHGGRGYDGLVLGGGAHEDKSVDGLHLEEGERDVG